MKEDRIKWKIILVIAVITFIITLILGFLLEQPPKSYRAIEGPTTEFIKTEGVFRPGGYVKFTLSPKIESIGGHYKGDVTFYPLSPDDMDQDHTVWPETKFEFGHAWGDSISSRSYEAFSIKKEVSIPNDENLAGQEIVFFASYNINYPVSDYPYFRNECERVEESVLVKLGNTTLSPEEEDWKEMNENNYFLLLFGILIIISFTVGGGALLKLNKKC